MSHDPKSFIARKASMRIHRPAVIASMALFMVLLAVAMILRSNTNATAFTPPASGAYVAIDCDLTTPGVQDSCQLPAGTSSLEVAVVIGNVNFPPMDVAGFNLSLESPDQALIQPNGGQDSAKNSNPDFNDAAFDPSWTCYPSIDADPSPSSIHSQLFCFGDPPLQPLGPGSTVVVAFVRYVVQQTTGSATISPKHSSVNDPNGRILVWCSSQPASCRDTHVSFSDDTPTPTVTVPTLTDTPTVYATPTPAPSGCPLPGMTFVAMPTSVSGIGSLRIDDQCQYLFLTNTAANEVRVYSLSAGGFLAPIQVGSSPLGMDFSPDGRLLYVANHGSFDISVINLTTFAEIDRIPLPPDPGAGGPASLAVDFRGKLLVSTRSCGSCNGTAIYQIDPADRVAVERRDFGAFTQVDVWLSPSGDRTKIMLTDHYGVAEYDAVTDTIEFPPVEGGNWVATDEAGSMVLVSAGDNFILDENRNLVGTIPSKDNNGGVAVSPDGSTGYLASRNQLSVIDMSRFSVVSEITLPDSLTASYVRVGRGEVELGADGQILAVTTDHGFVLMPAPSLPAVPSPTPAVPTPTPIGSACTPMWSSPHMLPIASGGLGKPVVDRWCRHAYVPNATANRVEVVDLKDGVLESPIAVGSQPASLDISPDGSTLYVANGGGNYLSIVDLPTRLEVQRVFLPITRDGYEVPSHVSTIENSRVMFVANRLWQMDVPSTTVSPMQLGVFSDGRIQSSNDHRRLVIITGFPEFSIYDASYNIFTSLTHLASFVYSYLAITNDGSAVAMSGSSTNLFVFDDSGLQLASIPGSGSAGIAFSNDGRWLYRIIMDHVDIVEVYSGLTVGQLLLGDLVTPLYGTTPGLLSAGLDDTVLIATTDHGISLIRGEMEGDGVPDVVDNCRFVANSDQLNTDKMNRSSNRAGGDLLGDACDDDADGDGYSNTREISLAKDIRIYCAYMRADVNGDTVINPADLGLTAMRLGRRVGTREDQNGDDWLNAADLGMIARHSRNHLTICS